MLATAVTLALFGFILTLVVDLIRRDGAKILAALEGRSNPAQPTAGRPITIRVSRPGKAAVRTPLLPELRAAA